VTYGFAETGYVALGCARRQAPDDVHVCSDRYAVITRNRQVAETGVTLDALLVSTLSLTAPKILLNAESGDFAALRRRSCGCALESLNLRDHLWEVRSFEKLTGEGMTFARTNLVRIVEERLPARFGGTGTDYQLLEYEAADGLQRLALLVSPRLGTLDEVAVRRTLLDELARDGPREAYMARFWERAETVEVRRRVPVATRAGKVYPFHVVRGKLDLACAE
jgi:hypothetical protein